MKSAIDNFLSGLIDCFESMETILSIFSIDLCLKYENDLNKIEFTYHTESLK